MFKVISDIMEQWYLMVNAFIITINFYNEKEYELCIDVYHKQS